MVGLRYFLIIINFIFCIQTGKSQHHYFRNYQADDGLLHNTVYSIIQDRKDFIWIGTKSGLNRFDGYSFKSISIPINRSGVNCINTICEDKNGIIWIGTNNGIFSFDPDSESFKELKLASLGKVNDIQVDEDNTLFITCRGYLHLYNQKKSRLRSTTLYHSAMGLDKNGYLWMGTAKGELKTFHIKTNTLKKINLNLEKNLISLEGVTKILPLKQEVLIGTKRNGLFVYNIKTQKTTSILTKNPDGTEIYVRDIMLTNDQRYWIATESGIYIYNPSDGTYFILEKKTGDPYSLTDNAIYALCEDKQNGIWVGTFFSGLNYSSVENNFFEKYYPLNEINSISGDAVREICQDEKNNLWIGTEDAGINKLDLKTGKFSHFTTKNKSSDISYPNIHGLLATGDNIYAGPFVRGMEILNQETGKIVKKYPVIKSRKNNINIFIMCIFKTSDNRILIGTTGAGLFEYKPSSQRFEQINYIPKDGYVLAITEDHTGTIWTGSLKSGTFYFNTKTGKHGNISFNNIDNSQNDNYMVQGIHEDTRHNLWFCTEGRGVVKLDRDRKTFKSFTIKDGLPSNYTYRILEDDNKNLWISSLKGLICLNTLNEKIRTYKKSNGLITDQFNYNSALKDKQGKMYFGSVKGMIAFHPNEIRKANSGPPIYITGFQINNKETYPRDQNNILKKSILITDSIRLKHNQSSFSIEFASLNFSSPEVIRYKYKMKGLDTTWTYLSTNRKAYFTDLSAGNYQFIVQAESNVDLWKGAEKVIFIEILPPFWKSSFAYLIYLSSFFFLIYFTVNIYHQNIHKRNQHKLQLFELQKNKEVYEAKIEFFTNIAHEIQTPLTLIKGPIEWTLDKLDDIPTVRRNLKLVKKNTNRLIALTSQLLDFRKSEMSAFELNFVLLDINYVLNDQIKNFKTQLDKKEFNFKLETPKSHIKAFVDKEAFTKIIINLMSNTVKYAKKHITIILTEEVSTESFKIRFINDGNFIEEKYYQKIFEPFYRIQNADGTEGTGIGLSLAKSLSELHRGGLTIIKNNEQLNIFELTLPIHQKIEFELSN